MPCTIHAAAPHDIVLKYVKRQGIFLGGVTEAKGDLRAGDGGGDYWLVGTFDSDKAAEDWGSDPNNNPENDPRW